MKKYFFVAAIVCLSAANMAHAQSTVTCQPGAAFCPIAPIPGLTQIDGQNIQPDEKGIATFLNNLYTFCIGIAVVLAIIMIIWGGTEIALSRGSVASVMDGKGKIVQALLGLVLVLSPALVFSIINPSILKLNVNIPPLETAWGNYAPLVPGVATGDCTNENNANTPECVEISTQRCISSGGTPHVVPISFGRGNSVYCDMAPQSPALTPSSDQLTVAQCTALGGRSFYGRPSTNHPYSTCSNDKIPSSERSSWNTCSVIPASASNGTGACLYTR